MNLNSYSNAQFGQGKISQFKIELFLSLFIWCLRETQLINSAQIVHPNKKTFNKNTQIRLFKYLQGKNHPNANVLSFFRR